MSKMRSQCGDVSCTCSAQKKCLVKFTKLNVKRQQKILSFLFDFLNVNFNKKAGHFGIFTRENPKMRTKRQNTAYIKASSWENSRVHLGQLNPLFPIRPAEMSLLLYFPVHSDTVLISFTSIFQVATTKQGEFLQVMSIGALAQNACLQNKGKKAVRSPC